MKLPHNATENVRGPDSFPRSSEMSMTTPSRDRTTGTNKVLAVTPDMIPCAPNAIRRNGAVLPLTDHRNSDALLPGLPR